MNKNDEMYNMLMGLLFDNFDQERPVTDFINKWSTIYYCVYRKFVVDIKKQHKDVMGKLNMENILKIGPFLMANKENNKPPKKIDDESKNAEFNLLVGKLLDHYCLNMTVVECYSKMVFIFFASYDKCIAGKVSMEDISKAYALLSLENKIKLGIRYKSTV